MKSETLGHTHILVFT